MSYIKYVKIAFMLLFIVFLLTFGYVVQAASAKAETQIAVEETTVAIIAQHANENQIIQSLPAFPGGLCV